MIKSDTKISFFSLFNMIILTFTILVFVLAHQGEGTEDIFLNDSSIAFLILSSPGTPHETIAKTLKLNIMNQIPKVEGTSKVLVAPGDFSHIQGYWTIFPLLERLSELQHVSWIFFLQENTGINVQNLQGVLNKHKKSSFVGFAVKDEQPTIIHHFDEPQSSVSYPNLATGMALSFHLLRRVVQRWKEAPETNFAIDAIYEFSKFIYESCDAVKLAHEPLFCNSERHDQCTTWISRTFLSCEKIITSQNVFFAVKTCHKFHSDRVPVVKKTWASDANRIIFYSDVNDANIPTIVLGVKNVPHGHCMKTIAIIKHFVDNRLPEEEWLVIADDDTLFSIPRLLLLLSCYNSSEALALGERYGYAAALNHGYDYITGGGGMVFSVSTARTLAKFCECPSIDSPDDMVIGMCLKNLDIPIIHLPHFHQARPEDYNEYLIASYLPISFHKHWMTDPYNVYQSYLKNNYFHDEF